MLSAHAPCLAALALLAGAALATSNASAAPAQVSVDTLSANLTALRGTLDATLRRVAALEAGELAAKSKVLELEASADRTWKLSTAFSILQMQAGFAMLEAGSTSSSSTASILMKNMADLAVGTLGFYVLGWGLAFGPSDANDPNTNSFAGTGDFALVGNVDYASWMFHASFAATAATIVSGAVAGRIKFKMYVLLSIIVTSLVYPIPAHVAWDSRGFGYGMGFVDFAGGGVVHAAGGIMGLLATLRLGPRQGVFSESGAYFPVRSSPTTAVLGVLLLIVSFFSFNAGSTTSVSNGADLVAALVAVNTGLASAGGSIAGMVYSWARSGGKYIDIYETANGALCGLVGITAGCASVTPWEAAIIGCVSALLGSLTSATLPALRIDDPVGVTPVHLVSGIFGIICVGLFAADPASRPDLPMPQGRAGLFHGGGFELLGVQCLLLLFVLAWSGVAFGVVLVAVDMTLGLRVGKDEERMLDALEHNLLMVKVQEEFGDSEDYDSEDGSRAGSRRSLGSRGRSRRSLGSGGGSKRGVHTTAVPGAAEGQLMTMDGGLTRPQSSPTAGAVRVLGGPPMVEDGGSVRKRRSSASKLAAAAGPAAPRDAKPGAGRQPRKSTSGRRGKRGKGGRRRSMTYHVEEVTYMTAEELAAAHTGKMDGTDVAEAMPAAVSRHVGNASNASGSRDTGARRSRSRASGSHAEAGASHATLEAATDATAAGQSAEPSVAEPADAPTRTKLDLTDAPDTPVAEDESPSGRRTVGAPELRHAKGKKHGPKSKAVVEMVAWQSPQAVEGRPRAHGHRPGVEGSCAHQ